MAGQDRISDEQIQRTVLLLEARLAEALRVSQEASDLLEPWRALLQEREAAKSEAVVEEPERPMTINDIAEKFFGIKDFTKRTPFDKEVGK